MKCFFLSISLLLVAASYANITVSGPGKYTTVLSAVPAAGNTIDITDSVDFTGWAPPANITIRLLTANARFYFNGALNVPTMTIYAERGNARVTGDFKLSKISTNMATVADNTVITSPNVTTTDLDMASNNTNLKIVGNFAITGANINYKSIILSVTGNLTSSSAVNVTVDQQLVVGGDMTVNNGNLNINGQGNVAVNGSLKIPDGTFHNDNNATIGKDLSAKYIEINGSGKTIAYGDVSGATSQPINGAITIYGIVSPTNIWSCNGGAIIKYYKTVNTTSGSIGASCNAYLPITLVDFSGKQVGSEIVLNWKTLSEFENQSFSIERSLEGNNFTQILQTKGAGTTQLETRYELTDQNPVFGVNYYRLRQTDFNGTESLSKVISVTFESDKAANITLMPNFAKRGETIHCTLPESTASGVELLSAAGMVIKYYTLSGTTAFDIETADLLSGKYFLRLLANGQMKQFIVE